MATSGVAQLPKRFRRGDDAVGGDLVDRTVEQRRRTLQVALGVVWLIDAALQYQPYMFTRGFVTNALESAAPGNPWLLYRPMIWVDQFMIHDIAWWNVLYATVQLLIALGLFWRPTVRWALGTSVAWGLAVWWLAEGFGGVFSGSSPLAGEPGAVLLYVVVAVLVWPPREDRGGTSLAQRGPWGARGATALWALLWTDFAVYFLLPTNRSPQGPSNLVAAVASGEPRWLQSIDRGLADALANRGVAVSVVFALVCVVVAIGVVVAPLNRAALIVAVVFAAAVWLTQDFGAILTSQGTDVNSGPLIALLAVAYWPLTPRRRSPDPA